MFPLLGWEQKHTQPKGRRPAQDANQGATGPTGVCMMHWDCVCFLIYSDYKGYCTYNILPTRWLQLVCLYTFDPLVKRLQLSLCHVWPMSNYTKAKEEEYGRNPRPKLLKEVQEAKKHISLLQEQLSKAAATLQVETHTYTCMLDFSLLKISK